MNERDYTAQGARYQVPPRRFQKKLKPRNLATITALAIAAWMIVITVAVIAIG